MVEKLAMKSKNMSENHIKSIQKLFPNVVTEKTINGITTLAIDFELLNNDCVKNIVIAGKYVHDLAIRLKYANIIKITEKYGRSKA